MNLLEVAEYNMEQEIGFSKDAHFELGYLSRAVDEALHTTINAYQQETESVCHKIGPLEDVVDDMVETLKSKRIVRLQNGACTTEGGISYIEVLTNMERISDHCINISMHLHQRILRQSLDTHKRDILDREADEYKAMKVYFEKQYLDPVR